MCSPNLVSFRASEKTTFSSVCSIISAQVTKVGPVEGLGGMHLPPGLGQTPLPSLLALGGDLGGHMWKSTVLKRENEHVEHHAVPITTCPFISAMLDHSVKVLKLYYITEKGGC